MGSTIIHPKQRRIACDACRKQKSRCHRVLQTDASCSRCMMLGLKCTAGQQRKIGRPQQMTTYREDLVIRHPTSEDHSTLTTKKPYNQGFPRKRHETLSPAQGTHHQRPSEAFPAFISASLPSTSEMNSHFSDLFPWDVSNAVEQSLPTSTTASTLDFETSTVPSAYTPSTNSPSAIFICASPSEAKATSFPADLGATDGITTSDALAKLSQINIQLHARVVVADVNRETINLNSIIYQNGPLFCDNFTLAEFIIKTSQDFLTILTRLIAHRSIGALLQPLQAAITYPRLPLSSSSPSQNQILLWPHTSARAPTKPLPASLVLTMTSIFSQLLTLLELTLEHFIPRIRRIHVEPIAPIPDLTFGGTTLAEPCEQGIVFSKIVIHLLERIEQDLGIDELLGLGAGLLSDRQKEVLWNELGEGFEIGPTYGAARPANVRNSFQTVIHMFHQVNLPRL